MWSGSFFRQYYVMPLDRCLNFHNPTAGSWDSPSCPLIGQYWPLLWRHRSSKHAQLATPRSFLWYSVLGLGNLGGKRHPSTNNIPLSFPKLKDSFPLSQMQWLVVNHNFCDILSIFIFEFLIHRWQVNNMKYVSCHACLAVYFLT